MLDYQLGKSFVKHYGARRGDAYQVLHQQEALSCYSRVSTASKKKKKNVTCDFWMW